MKKHKSKKSVQKSASNASSNAEVFVLTPEILAKLGINIQTAQVPDTNLIADLERIPEQNTSNTLQNGNAESSIIETANLMKESVFLSPTFNETSNATTEINEPINANVSYPLITNNNVQFIGDENPLTHRLEEVIRPDMTDNTEINNDTLEEQTTNDLSPNESIEEYQVDNQDGNFVLNEVSSTNTPCVESSFAEAIMVAPLKEHTDNSYLLPDNSSDKSKDVTENLHPKDNESGSSNKIRIISEQVIVDLAELKQVANLKLSNDATLIPITVDAVVTGKPVNKNCVSSKSASPSEMIVNQQTETRKSTESKHQFPKIASQTLKEKNKQNALKTTANLNGEVNKIEILPSTPTIKSKIKQKNKITVINTKNEEKLNDGPKKNTFSPEKSFHDVLNVTQCINTSQNKHPIQINQWNGDSQLSKKIIISQDVNNCDEIQIDDQTVDKTSTSSASVENHFKNHGEMPEEEIDKNNEKAIHIKQFNDINIIEKKPEISNQKIAEDTGSHVAESEKDQHKLKFSKTYKRNVINRQLPATVPVTQQNFYSFQLPNNFNIKEDGTIGIKSGLSCICFDFGNLSYYEPDVMYEHIHFWETKIANTNAEIVYSIYNDQSCVSKDTDYDELPDDDETTGHKICWNEFIEEENDYEFKTGDLRVVEKAVARNTDSIDSSKNITLPDLAKNDEPGKGANVTNAVNKSSEEIRSQSETTVGCGICKELILETEWENHNESEHDFLGWRSDQINIDFTNENLLRTITRRLKVDGFLMCPVCNTKIKRLNKFTQHVARCIKLKESYPVIAQPSSSPTRPTRRLTRNSLNNKGDSSVDLDSSNSKINYSNEAFSSLKKSTKLLDNKKTHEKLPKSTGNSPDLSITVKKPHSYTEKSSNMEGETLTRNIKLERNDPNLPSNKSFHGNDSEDENTAIEIVKCGVCKKTIENGGWSEHLSKEHNYLAWREGDSELNLNNEEQVKNHLKNISKQLGGLVCSKCGLTRKVAKQFLNHIKSCSGVESNPTASDLNSTLENDEDDEALSTKQSRKSRKRNFDKTLTTVTCGVCKTTVPEQSWIEHIQMEHKYLAWKDGDKPLDVSSEDEVKNHLNDIAKIHGLICNKCGVTWRYGKKYLAHEGNCKSSEGSVLRSVEYECGICHDKGNMRDWKKHALKTHYNIAWMVNQTPINLKDLDTIDKLLNEYKLTYSFICNNCKCAGTSSLEFYAHIMTCGKTEQEIDAVRDTCKICGEKYLCMYEAKHTSMHKKGKVSRKRSRMSNDPDEGSAENSGKRAKSRGSSDGIIVKQEPVEEGSNIALFVEIELNPLIKCGVCKADVAAKDWINHSMREHAYLAWIEGEESFDTNDPEQVRRHLNRILNTMGVLVCNHCGITKKNEHSYRQHIPACDKSGFKIEITVPLDLKKDEYECGVCNERGALSKFKEHAMQKHYNIAWAAGDIPINLKNFYAVEKYLREYQTNHPLVCHVCNATRSSCYGFYAHILQCGKTADELEEFQSVCDICSNKYLCIYRNQHMTMHREQTYKKHLKEMKEEKRNEEMFNKSMEQDSSKLTPGKRKAAVKATGFIKKHSSIIVNVEGKSVCSCGKIFLSQEEQSRHKCRDDLEADVSVKMEADESDSESEGESVVSAEEEQKKEVKVKTRQGEGANKLGRMPFRVDNYNAHLSAGNKDFVNFHYSSEMLFEEWRNTEYSLVPKEDLEKYLPPLQESCKVRIGSNNWVTYDRFQATNENGICLFTGGTIQCMSWAPMDRSGGACNSSLENYLCVSSHLGADVPRVGPGERGREHSLLQIWSFGKFSKAPKLSLGIALDFGIIWAVDWCPSGTRDTDPKDASSAMTSARLGLLAVACSDGSAYIFAVPYPTQQNELENIIYKLNPVAELRISMSSTRRIYQATSIHWSQQKGHKIIIVGYSDGTTALYDLLTESPLLRGNEDGVNIFYPFQDKLSESTAITGAFLMASSNPHYPLGGVCTASITGGTLRAVTSSPSVRLHVPATAAAPASLWPALNLYGDGAFTANIVTELEWCSVGRRLGAARCGASCAECARIAAVCAPAVRIVRAHPIYPEIKKQIVAALVMLPLNQKGKRKQVTDELSMVVEPLTYDDAVSKYGLKLTYFNKKNQQEAQKMCNENDSRPERFPLSEIVTCAFCNSPRYHDKLALGTHAGLIFVIDSQ